MVAGVVGHKKARRGVVRRERGVARGGGEGGGGLGSPSVGVIVAQAV